MTDSKKSRDLRIDVAKGLAIILVIGGHTVQGLDPNFDDSIVFRAIYSFHMPFFFFLSGMVVSLKFSFAPSETESVDAILTNLKKPVLGAAVRLLVPFAFWTGVSYYFGHRDLAVTEWIGMVLKSPDHSLWFLFALFLFLCLWNLFLTFMRGMLFFKKDWDYQGVNAPIAKVLIAFSSMMVVDFATNPLGGTYGIGLIKIHYGYFCAGIIYNILMPNGLSGMKRLVPYVVFATLIPFWYRTHPGPVSVLLQDLMIPERSHWIYRIVVAISGILVMLDVVNVLSRVRLGILNKTLAICGIASIGIYAFHYYVLPQQPFVVAPLLWCLAFYWVLVDIPVVRTVLFGERGPSKLLPLLAPILNRLPIRRPV